MNVFISSNSSVFSADATFYAHGVPVLRDLLILRPNRGGLVEERLYYQEQQTNYKAACSRLITLAARRFM